MIDTSFQLVASDLVELIVPVTKRKTYLKAIALPSCETERVVDEIFENVAG